ncbi:Phosphatidylserine decarboxylase proenzyme [Thermotalea metallivorans]|uniref:Phosphatidylserine decarboxylase proenzyme n=2 Tax=Thermotalea metallivorans TaxID=520762 RepID=A0A140L363_9FIRM|nr:Phosphatidylserine decarboxylase proenzyme [Thermotalea metallivorans]
MMEIYYIDRKTGKKQKEKVAGHRFLQWIYHTNVGDSLLEMIVKRKIFSSIYGKLQDLPFSKKKIWAFIEELDIDMAEAERESAEDYRHFNDFFARKLKKDARPICRDEGSLVSPADGRVLAYEQIDIDRVVQIKNLHYRLEDLLGDRELAMTYQGGTCIVIRLCPADYHRFHFPDSGVPGPYKGMKGQYYSVNPIALKKIPEIYIRNKREITLFVSDHFGQIVMIEVGATCVGSIVQTYRAGEKVEKGQEKGYFKFGGSTVILFLKPDTIAVDQDLLQNTREGFETKVNMGERLGKVIQHRQL